MEFKMLQMYLVVYHLVTHSFRFYDIKHHILLNIIRCDARFCGLYIVHLVSIVNGFL